MLNDYAAVAQLLRDAGGILFITGAGLSVDSGLPTYRGIGGLYEAKSTDEGIPIEHALSGRMLEERPEITWKYLWQIGEVSRGARPNRGHEVIAEIEQAKPRTWVLTQNVDGLHRSAGSRNLIEVHGRAGELYCLACAARFEAGALFGDYAERPELPPRCPQCGGLVRPEVVLFGEWLGEATVAAMERLEQVPLDMIFTVGTSAVFPYIAGPVVRGRQLGIATVEINPVETQLSGVVEHRFTEGAAAALDKLWRMARD